MNQCSNCSRCIQDSDICETCDQAIQEMEYMYSLEKENYEAWCEEVVESNEL